MIGDGKRKGSSAPLASAAREGMRGALGRMRVMLVIAICGAFLIGSVASYSISVVGDFGATVAEMLGRRVTVSTTEATRVGGGRTPAPDAGTRRPAEQRELDRDLARVRSERDAAMARLQGKERELEVERTRLRALQKDHARLTQQAEEAAVRLAQQRRRADALRRSTEGLTDGIARRVERMTVRSIGSVPAESLPILGAATIATMTALEIRDACLLMKDLRDLRGRADVEQPDPGWFETTCSRTVAMPADALRNMSVNECYSHASDQRRAVDGDWGDEVYAELRAVCDCKADGRTDCYADMSGAVSAGARDPGRD